MICFVESLELGSLFWAGFERIEIRSRMRIRKRSVGVKSSSSCLEPEGRKFLLPLAGGEGHKPNYKWNGIMRNGRNKSILLASGDRMKKETSRSLDQQISKSEGIPKLFVSVDDLTVKKKRSKKYHAIGCDGVQYYNAGSKEDDINLNSNQAVHKPKTSDDINHGGSQCKRRNGRGWRCSQRTLVGYSLCEHHLGKSRFKNINASNSAVTVSVNNNKGVGSKYKELHLINATHM